MRASRSTASRRPRWDKWIASAAARKTEGRRVAAAHAMTTVIRDSAMAASIAAMVATSAARVAAPSA